jgi:hypothetical protein
MWTKEQLIKILRDPHNTADYRGWQDKIEHLESLCRQAADMLEAPQPEDGAMRARIITECREACMAVHANADEAAEAKDAVGEPYKTGYIDAAIDCDEALFRLLNCSSPQEEKGR